ncbi:hypothetical protein LVJ94_01095 [Pendulispora rubella]|uniref:Bacterial Pleckstrin homology domain-containing protein n=1 Tax=Pendulispora rubella TaxID=2741070 RepID=A0ABZ2L4I9_9BACT
MKFEISAVPRAVRVGLVALQVVAIANALYLVQHIVTDVLEGTQTAPPRAVAMGLFFFSGVPWVVVSWVRRILAGTLETNDTHIILSLRRSRLEIPIASVKAIRPLVIPLPRPGFEVDMQSGHLFRYRLLASEPGPLLSMLAQYVGAARTALKSPAIAYADAKWKHTWRRRAVALVKWGLYPLVLAVLLFRLDQYIMFGGAFGQYYLQGLAPYLQSFVTYWAASASYLVLYAVVVRLVVEPLVFAATWPLAAHAGLLRKLGEGICQFAYFVLVPALVAFRLLN